MDMVSLQGLKRSGTWIVCGGEIELLAEDPTRAGSSRRLAVLPPGSAAFELVGPDCRLSLYPRRGARLEPAQDRTLEGSALRAWLDALAAAVATAGSGEALPPSDRDAALADPLALDRVHAWILVRIGEWLHRREEAEAERIAALLNGRGTAGDADPLGVAIARIAEAHGVDASPRQRLSPAGGTDRHRAIVSAAESVRMRARRIRLEPGWTTRLEEPLLGFREADGVPVALLPARRFLRRSSFRILAPEGTGTDAALEPFGYSFLPVLPDEAVSGVSLLRFGLQRGGRELLSMFLVAMLATLLGLAVPFATGLLFDDIVPNGARADLVLIGIGLSAASLGTTAFSLVRGHLSLRLTTALNARLEVAIWDRLLRLPIEFFRGRTAGDLAGRAGAINAMRDTVSATIVSTALSAVFGILNFVLLLHYSWRLAVLATGLVLVQAVVGLAAALVQMRLQRQGLEVGAEVQASSFELIEGIAKLRVAAAEDRAFGRWAVAFTQRNALALRGRLTNGATSAFGVAWATLSSAFLLAAVGMGWAPVQLGDWVGFSTAFGQFSAAAASLIGILPTMLALRPLQERARPILETVPEDAGGKADPGMLGGDVELRNVVFRYAPHAPAALDGVSLSVRPGELIALVGASGSGKSTALRLLLGFERPCEGSVLLDGRDLANLDPRAVRRQLGVVLQQGRVQAGTLLDNIAGGAPLTPDEAMEAARIAGLDTDIRALPLGLYTPLPEGGGALSGGQLQRLMIARAVARRPRILILDEATSALDNRTQEIVARNLDELRITRLVVAHRLSTVRHADRIYVLEHGRVVEEGTFGELMALDGAFSRLATRQMR